MAVHVEAKIIVGLIGWFDGVALPSGVGVLAEALPNRNFTPTVSTPYVELKVRKNQPQNAHIGGGIEPIRLGIFLANVYWPKNQGLIKPSELAGTIRDRFKFGTRIDHDGISIWITEEPVVQGDEQGPVYSVTPVVVPWRVLSS